jgi:hypothetical protein
MALNQLRSDQLLSGSLYPITSSWALRAVSASISNTSSYISPTFISESAASSGFGTGGGGSPLVTGSTYPITSSWAITSSVSISSSFSTTSSFSVSSSLSTTSSYISSNFISSSAAAEGFGPQLVTGSTYPITSSWSITSSFSTTSSYISPTFISASAASSGFGVGGGGGGGILVNTSSLITATLTSSTQQFVGDGLTANYGLNELSKSATDFIVFINGIGQRPTASYNVVSQSTIVFTSPPASGSNVEIRYFTTALQVSFATSSIGAEYYTGNNSSSVFLLTQQYVYHDYDVIVSLDGLIQKPTIDYTINSGSYLNFIVPPPTDTDIEVRYIVVTTTAISTTPKAVPPTILTGTNIDWLINDNFEKQVSNSESYTFTNTFSGKSLVFILANTGSSTVIPAFPSTVKWSAGISPQGTLSNYVSVYTFYKSNYYLLGNCVENYL